MTTYLHTHDHTHEPTQPAPHTHDHTHDTPQPAHDHARTPQHAHDHTHDRPQPSTAPINTCKAGSYDTDKDGVIDYFLECHANGKRKKRTAYHADTAKKSAVTTYWESTGNLKTRIGYQSDGVTKSYESTHWESNGNQKTRIVYRSDGVTKSYDSSYWESNGNRKTGTSYRPDGTKSFEYSYWESNGNQKTYIAYQDDGVKKSSESTYWESTGNQKTRIDYQSDGAIVSSLNCYDSTGLREACHPIRHGLPDAYMTLTYHDSPANTKVDSYIQYNFIFETKKLFESTYWESNGNRKTEIAYQSDGVKKSSESTYWESTGNIKTRTSYQSDGVTVSSVTKYTYWEHDDDGHDDDDHDDDHHDHGHDDHHHDHGSTFRTSNGNLKTSIAYQSDGVTVSSVTCYDSTGTSEHCHPIRHGLPAAYMTLTYHDSPTNTKVNSYIQYKDTAKETKLYESTYWESAGNIKTNIDYQSDGVTLSSVTCYDSTGASEYCHPITHGLPAAYMTLTYYPSQPGAIGIYTNVNTYIQYRDTAKTKKYYESTLWESNGNIKTNIAYQSDGSTKWSKSTFWENGNIKTSIAYQLDGSTKFFEFIYWESNGNIKTHIGYGLDGTISSITCYDNTGVGEAAEEACHPITHGLRSGLLAAYMTLTYHDSPTNTKVNNYIQYTNTDKATKLYKSTFKASNGKIETRIDYQDDGDKKASVSTYWESNGNIKTKTSYQSDGATVSSVTKYTYWENGNQKTQITYQSDGVTVSSVNCYDSTGAGVTCTLAHF